jgi:hypothetical protein
MSTTVTRARQRDRGAWPSGLGAGFQALRLPLEAWGRARRLAVAAAIAAAIFGAGAYGWETADLGRVQFSQAALADTEHRLSAARAAIARLPALRAEIARAASAPDVRGGSPTGSWHAIAALAGHSGLQLQAMEPAPARGEGFETVRPMRIAARADFAALRAFLHGLPSLPVLAVPTDLRVKREAGDLAFSTTLEVFDALPPAHPLASLPAADSPSERGTPSFFDPFSPGAAADATVRPALHLVGVLSESGRRLALLVAEDGATAVETGQAIGREKVERIDDRRVTLAHGGITRVLAFAEAAR